MQNTKGQTETKTNNVKNLKERERERWIEKGFGLVKDLAGQRELLWSVA